MTKGALSESIGKRIGDETALANQTNLWQFKDLFQAQFKICEVRRTELAGSRILIVIAVESLPSFHIFVHRSEAVCLFR